MSSSLGVLTMDLICRTGAFTGPLSKAERELKTKTDRMNKMAYNMGQSFGQSMKSAAGHVLAFAGVSLTIGAAASSFKKAIDYADGLRDASIRLGMSTESLSAFSFAAKQTGTDLETLQKGLKALSRNATEAMNPKSAQAGLFASMGISKGALTDLNTLLPQVAEHFSKMADGPQKAALAMELFGKSGTDLIELLNQGAGGLQSFGDRARELGMIIDRETANAADDFNDKLGELKTAQEGVTTQIIGGMLPALRGLVEGMSNAVTKGGDLKDLGSGIGQVMIYAANGVSGMARVVKTLAITAAAAVSDLEDYYNISKQIMSLGMADGTIKQSAENIKRNGAQYKSEVNAVWDKPWFGANAQASAADKAREAREKAVEARAAARRAREAANAWIKPVAPTGGGGGGGGRVSRSSGVRSTRMEAPKIDKEAEEIKRAQDAYKSFMATMDERIFMIGKEGEAARVSWEIQHGELQKLGQAEKDLALEKAKRVDNDMENQRKAEEAERQGKMRTDYIASLQEEVKLLGMTNEQQEIYNAKKILGAEATDQQREAVVMLTTEAQNLREVRGLAEETGDAFGNLFMDVASGSKSAKDAFKDFFDTLYNMALQFIAKNIAKKVSESMMNFGSEGSSGGGWMSALMNSFSTNSTTGGFGGGSSDFGGGLAIGGPARSNTLYRVNENGPELLSVSGKDYLMMGASSGRVTPNNKISGGGMSQTNVFHLGAPTDPRTQQQIAKQVSYESRRAAARNA